MAWIGAAGVCVYVEMGRWIVKQGFGKATCRPYSAFVTYHRKAFDANVSGNRDVRGIHPDRCPGKRERATPDTAPPFLLV